MVRSAEAYNSPICIHKELGSVMKVPKLILFIILSVQSLCCASQTWTYDGGKMVKQGQVWTEYSNNSPNPKDKFTETRQDQYYYYITCDRTQTKFAIPKGGGNGYWLNGGKYETFINRATGQLLVFRAPKNAAVGANPAQNNNTVQQRTNNNQNATTPYRRIIDNSNFEIVTPKSDGSKYVERFLLCPECRGAGGNRCSSCRGTGYDRVLDHSCYMCSGLGTEECSTCKNYNINFGTGPNNYFKGHVRIGFYIERKVSYIDVAQDDYKNYKLLKVGDGYMGSKIKTISFSKDNGYADWSCEIQLVNGDSDRMTYSQCFSCRGLGTCPICHGKGYAGYSPYSGVLYCNSCSGRAKCSRCEGSKIGWSRFSVNNQTKHYTYVTRDDYRDGYIGQDDYDDDSPSSGRGSYSRQSGSSSSGVSDLESDFNLEERNCQNWYDALKVNSYADSNGNLTVRYNNSNISKMITEFHKAQNKMRRIKSSLQLKGVRVDSPFLHYSVGY